MNAIETKSSAGATLFRHYRNAIQAIAGVSMLAIVVIMIVQVAARYLFGASLIWAEELCRYILIWQTFLLVGFAYHQGELVALDILGNFVRPTTKLIVRFLISAPVCVFLYLMIKTGLAYAGRFTAQNIPAMDFIWTSLFGTPAQLPIFWVYVAIPVGCAILLVHFVGAFVYDAYAVATGSQTIDEARKSQGGEQSW